MDWETSKKLLLNDLSAIDKHSKNPDKVRFFWGNESFTINELSKEIEDETEIGKKHIQLRIDTEEKIKEILNKKSTKKKRNWKFWK